jgi:DNA-binding NarL/FixJ family response regulator
MREPPYPANPGPPPGLRVETFASGGLEFAILEWPVPAAPADLRAGLPLALCEVLDLVLAGHSNAEIARKRRRSVRTVAHQVDGIFHRLGVGSRFELHALASRPHAAGGEP